MELLNGDCLEVMKSIPDKSVDMVLCDLPYGTTACKWDNVIPFEPMWEQYDRITKKNAAILLFSAQPFTTDLICSNRNKNKRVARHMTAEAKKAIIAVKQAVNNQSLRKRIIYALRIIGGRW